MQNFPSGLGALPKVADNHDDLNYLVPNNQLYE